MSNQYIGKKYGRLTVISRTEEKIERAYLYECLCDCGKTTYQVIAQLKNGHVKSCSCLQKEIVKEMNQRVNAGGTKNYPFTRKGDKGNKTGFRGVNTYTQSGKTKYFARLYFKGKKYQKKGFLTIEEALEYRKYLEDTYLPDEKKPK